MDDSTAKPAIKSLDSRTQQDEEASVPGAGPIMEMEALEAISVGNDPTSSEYALYGIKKIEGEMRQRARDAYRKGHPYAHPDDVENAIKDSFSNIGMEGRSGA
jgi:hypothetical protein